MTHPRVNIMPPERGPTPATGNGMDPRHDRNPLVSSFEAPQRASTSRRPSGASIHSQGAQIMGHNSPQPPHSPVSASSSNTHPWSTPREMDDRQPWSNSPQSGFTTLPSNSSGSGQQGIHKNHRLPRLTTPGDDQTEHDEEGPRSAPTSSPMTGTAAVFGHQPPRSSSTPDPRTSGPNSNRSSPVTSPTDARPSFSGSLPYQSSSQADPRYPAPRAAFMANAPSSSSSAYGDGAMAVRRSETPSSMSSAHGPSTSTIQSVPQSGQPQAKRSGSVTYCAKCGQAVRGQFVRALHQVYHLDCFRCKDCDKVVAQKFFPIEDGDAQYPLCERDYFARLHLICAKCDQALRSSYITACGEKFHVEHFSCSVCDTVFGPSDSYYEHDGKVYCHYHYSISFANKCVGCETAILKQFVEINRNGRDECWHPECYMIHKFWNVRLASRNFTTPAANTPVTSSVSLLEMSSLSMSPGATAHSNEQHSTWGNESTPEALKERQISMELKVSQIWLVLSGFEESSAACIGDMLRVVNERKLLDVILLAEKFILHVETLFAVIDDLEAQFALAGVKGMSHAREAKQLCRKLVNFFSMLSQISPHGGAIPNMQDLLQQVTQLAHYLKILIRIALTGAIKLDREQGNPNAMMSALARLHLLSLDNADPSLPKRGEHPDPTEPTAAWTGNESPEEMAQRSFDSLTRHPEGFIPSTQHIAYGYKSLAVETTGETTLRGPQDDRFVPNDGCAKCNGAIEDDCVRLGMFNRWHSTCVECNKCGDKASASKNPDSPIARLPANDDDSHEGTLQPSKPATKRRPPRVDDFLFEPPKVKYSPAETIWCDLHRTASAIPGFQSVSRLEQFAFLLHVALRRLYLHFREHHGIPSAVNRTETGHDVKRVKSVTLDRKLSSTARLPQRSTVVESPAGKMADENGQVVARRDTLPSIIPPETLLEDGPKSATVDVIRPPFARNNTQIRIVSEAMADENSPVQPSPREALPSLVIPRTEEDDALTLSDIPMLASRSNHPRSPMDSLPLMGELSPLESLIVRHYALIQVQKTGIGHLVDFDEVIELLDSRKNQWWNKIFKNNAKQNQKRKGIFGVPIEILVDRTGSDSQLGVNPNVQLRVPEFIEEIISTMRQQDMAVEGIFRKNGNIRKLQQLSELLDKDSASVVLADENPVQLAALLKRFLREMPDPLLTFRLHKLFCAAAVLPNPDDRKRTLQLLVTLLPKPNRDTLEVLFVFLRWVASFSYRDEETGSRMDLANLATVICPSILYARGQNAARDESFIAIQAVQQLLEAQDDIYHVPPDLQFVLSEKVHSIFSKDMDFPPKEIHKACIKYIQARGTQLRGGGGLTVGGLSAAPLSAGPTSAGPLSSGGIPRDRPADYRMSGYRSDSSAAGRDGRDPRESRDGPRDRDGRDGRDQREDRARDSRDPEGNALRTLPANNSRPTSWGANNAGGTTPAGPGSMLSMPTPHVNGSMVTTPTFPSHSSSLQHPLPTIQTPGWRGPFQGSASGSNGSRNSSRGSAPPSPGLPESDRRSFQLDRDRSRERAWTPTGDASRLSQQ